MSDPRYGDEPSMAEILASVRRIVAEDQTGSVPETASDQRSNPASEPVSGQGANPGTNSGTNPGTNPGPDPEAAPFAGRSEPELPNPAAGLKQTAAKAEPATLTPGAQSEPTILSRLLERNAQTAAEPENAPGVTPEENEESCDDSILDLVNPLYPGKQPGVAVAPNSVQDPVQGPVPNSARAPAFEMNAVEDFLSGDKALHAAFSEWVEGPGADPIRRIIRDELAAMLGKALRP